MREKVATICYASKHKFAEPQDYDPRMRAKKYNVRATLANNLRMLMDLRNPRWKQTELAKAAGVSQRTISNMLAGDDDKSGATLDRVDAVASVFGLNSWQLTMPGLPHDITHAKIITDVLTGYILADDGGKDLIHRVAEREGRYKHQANE